MLGMECEMNSNDWRTNHREHVCFTQKLKPILDGVRRFDFFFFGFSLVMVDIKIQIDLAPGRPEHHRPPVQPRVARGHVRVLSDPAELRQG